MHRGIAPLKSHAQECRVQESSVSETVFCIHINCPRINIQIIIIFPKSLIYFPSPLCMCSFVLEVSLVVLGDWRHQCSSQPGQTGRTPGLVNFQISFLHNVHCAVPWASGFWRMTIMWAHQVWTIYHLVTEQAAAWKWEGLGGELRDHCPEDHHTVAVHL